MRHSEPTAKGSEAAPAAAPVGVFRPPLPHDSHEVMQLFAIAARVVSDAPAQLADCDHRLQAMAQRLVAPEAIAASECLRLWRLFAKVAQVPKASLRVEAARALWRDLDALGQRLDLPPLMEWDELPGGVDAPEPIEVAGDSTTDELMTLASVKERAQQVAATHGQKHFPAAEAARLVASLNGEERRALFERLVGRGLLGRSDVNLLVRFLVRPEPPRPSDTTLVEVLQRLGAHLAQ